MPVSVTAMVTRVLPPPSGAVPARTPTCPVSVNLTALLSRLNRIWRTRVGSPSNPSSEPDRISAVSARPLASACGASVLTAPSPSPPPLGPPLRPQWLDGALDQPRQRKGGLLQVEPTGLDLRKIEHVVNDP